MEKPSDIIWIQPPQKWGLPPIGEIWQYRSLIYQLAAKDFRIRYRQTFLGFLWALVNPLISALLLGFVFTKITGTHTGTMNGFIFTMSGMVTWIFYATLVPEAMQGMMGAQNMVKKIYFPKMILPLYKIAAASLESIVSFGILILIIAFNDFGLVSSRIVLLPVYALFMAMLGLALAMWSNVLILYSRDFIHVIPHVIRLGMFVCPIAYPSSLVPEKWQWLYFCNPVSGFIELFRWLVFENYIFHHGIWFSMITAMLLIASAAVVFRTVEYKMADIL